MQGFSTYNQQNKCGPQPVWFGTMITLVERYKKSSESGDHLALQYIFVNNLPLVLHEIKLRIPGLVISVAIAKFWNWASRLPYMRVRIQTIADPCELLKSRSFWIYGKIAFLCAFCVFSTFLKQQLPCIHPQVICMGEWCCMLRCSKRWSAFWLQSARSLPVCVCICCIICKCDCVHAPPTHK